MCIRDRVELIWRSVARVEPDVSGLCLAELATVVLRNRRAGQCKYLPTVRTANQFGTSGDVTPLVAATHLELAACLLYTSYYLSLRSVEIVAKKFVFLIPSLPLPLQRK